MVMRKILLLLVLISAAILACSAALAEEVTYLHYVGQSLYATERAEEQELEGGLIRYTATTEVPSAQLKMETSTIARPSDGRWFSHTLIFYPASGEPQSISVEYEDERIHYVAEVGTRQEGDLLAQGEVIPLDNQFLSHYRLLLSLIDLKTFKERDFTLLLTANLLQLPMHVTNLGIEELQVGRAHRSAWHLQGEVTQPDGSKLVYDLYVDPADGMPLQYDVPSQRYTIYEQGWREEIEEAQATEEVERRDLGRFWEEDVYFESGGYRLAGTVSVPKGQGPWPGVVISGGSGPQDRDGNSKLLHLSIYKRLAHFLSEHGFVVLRFDKRNVGESEGNFNAVRLEDYVGDLTAAARFLAEQDYVDPERIGLIGHSEGGIIAPIVAARHPELIRALVLMAAPGRTLDKVILDQVRWSAEQQGIRGAELEELIAEEEDFFKQVLANEEETVLSFKGQRVPAALLLKDEFLHDPLETIAQVRCPVLILQGGKDVSVTIRDAELLAAALQQAGHTAYELKIFHKLDHLFMPVEGEKNIEVYQDATREFGPKFLNTLLRWMKVNLEGAPAGLDHKILIILGLAALLLLGALLLHRG
jgi:hypothetical protein